MTLLRRRARPIDGLGARLDDITRAAELARGRLPDEVVERAEAVVAQAGGRVGVGMATTVVALAGPTGAGKSTLFNALAGEELSPPGHRRPTTSAPTAAIWGDVDDTLLDWLEVPRRHRLEGGMGDLVLLDLPDFDSVQAANRAEAARVVGLADLTVWVVDPQKYADGSLHDGFLKPLASHGASMLVVLNQADRLGRDERAACLDDLERHLREDGLANVPTLAVSATTRLGIDELEERLGARVAAREAAAQRLLADVEDAAVAFEPFLADGEQVVGAADRARLAQALASASGVPVVVRAVRRAHARRGALATGWPWVRWLRRLRPDPLRRLRLAGEGEQEHSSLPAATPAQAAQIDAAVRDLARRSSEGLPEPWPGLVRRAALEHEAELPARLERTVSATPLPVRRPLWWGAMGALQWVLVVVTIVGALWLGALAGLAYLQLGWAFTPPDVEGVPVPTAMLVGGALAGLLLSMLAGIAVRFGARRRARRAERQLVQSMRETGDELVVAPVERELGAYRELGSRVRAARG